MDKLAVIRSIVGLRDEHSSFQNLTGFPMGISQREGKPHFGSVISQGAGAGRPGRAAVRRPVPGHAAQAVQQPRPGLPGPRLQRRRGWTATTWPAEAAGAMSRPTAVRSAAQDLLGQFDQFRRQVDNAEVDGMDERLPPRLRRADLGQGGQGARRRARGPEAPRPLRHRLADAPGRRRPDVERPAPDRPPAGRGRGALRDGRLRLLGHARRQLLAPQAAPAAVRPGHLGPGRRHLRPRPRPRRHRGRLGRVRPDAEDQQGRRPRPLGPGQLGACSPAAA